MSIIPTTDPDELTIFWPTVPARVSLFVLGSLLIWFFASKHQTAPAGFWVIVLLFAFLFLIGAALSRTTTLSRQNWSVRNRFALLGFEGRERVRYLETEPTVHTLSIKIISNLVYLSYGDRRTMTLATFFSYRAAEKLEREIREFLEFKR